MNLQRTSTNLLKTALIAASLLLGGGLAAQDQSSNPDAGLSPESEGKDVGSFHVTQSITFGGRISSVTGSQAMYDTLLNYQSGARVLEQSLTMQSTTHQDIFDTLTLNSFG